MADSSIQFHTESSSFIFKDESQTSNWLTEVIKLENKLLGNISVVFCSDDYLLQMNQQYLQHDTYTDIITFNYVEGNVIGGDLFISVDRVQENAQNLSIAFEQELKRVMVHGVLHLIGYDDKTPEDASRIRAKEDFYLTLQP